MKFINLLFLSLIVIQSACKENKKVNQDQIDSSSKELTKAPIETSDSLVYDNGIKIHWIKRGKGEKITKGDLAEIDYKVFLIDGKLIEGSHMFDGTFPFMVGFGMQTKGWDFVLNELKVGDEVEAFLPSDQARGEKGIEGLIPPNSDNIVYLKIVEKRKPDRIIDGVKVWTIAQNRKNKLLFNKENSITFHTMVSSPSHPLYYNSFRENVPFTFRMKDAGVVPGLKKALNNAKKADRLYVVVPSSQAYGDKGLQDMVLPNEPLFYNLYVVNVF